MTGFPSVSRSNHGNGMGIVQSLQDGSIQGEMERLRAATTALEGTFYQELFKVMRESVPESGLLGGSQGEDAFTSLLDQHLADVQASRSDRGIGSALYRWFTEGRNPEP